MTLFNNCFEILHWCFCLCSLLTSACLCCHGIINGRTATHLFNQSVFECCYSKACVGLIRFDWTDNCVISFCNDGEVVTLSMRRRVFARQPKSFQWEERKTEKNPALTSKNVSVQFFREPLIKKSKSFTCCVEEPFAFPSPLWPLGWFFCHLIKATGTGVVWILLLHVNVWTFNNCVSLLLLFMQFEMISFLSECSFSSCF